MANLDTLPIPILGKIAEYSRSKYDVNIAIILYDREPGQPRGNLIWNWNDAENTIGIRIRCDFIIDFPNENVRNWFHELTTDMITDRNGPPQLPLHGFIRQGTLGNKDIYVHYSRERWIEENVIPNTDRVKFRIPLFFRTEALSDNLTNEWDHIKGKIRDYMIQQSPNIMRFLFAPSDSIFDTQDMFVAYKLFPDDRAFSEDTWRDKLVQMGPHAERVYTGTYRWQFQIVNNTPQKLTDNPDDDTFILNLKL